MVIAAKRSPFVIESELVDRQNIGAIVSCVILTSSMSFGITNHKLSNDAICIIMHSTFTEKIACEKYIIFLAFPKGNFQNRIKNFL